MRSLAVRMRFVSQWLGKLLGSAEIHSVDAEYAITHCGCAQSLQVHGAGAGPGKSVSRPYRLARLWTFAAGVRTKVKPPGRRVSKPKDFRMISATRRGPIFVSSGSRR